MIHLERDETWVQAHILICIYSVGARASSACIKAICICLDEGQGRTVPGPGRVLPPTAKIAVKSKVIRLGPCSEALLDPVSPHAVFGEIARTKRGLSGIYWEKKRCSCLHHALLWAAWVGALCLALGMRSRRQVTWSL